MLKKYFTCVNSYLANRMIFLYANLSFMTCYIEIANKKQTNHLVILFKKFMQKIMASLSTESSKRIYSLDRVLFVNNNGIDIDIGARQ